MVVLKTHLAIMNPLAITAFQPMMPDAIPGYKLLLEIGKGATGVVYKAESLRDRRIVAIKVLHPFSERKPDFIQRLLREAELLKRLDHPNIVRGIDHGKIGDRHYFIMEFVDGRTLADVIHERTRLPEREAAQIALEVARGLDAAHAQRILHRDIKPSNICLTDNGRVKIMDFGLGRFEADTGLTLLGSIIGTPIYISPEQACGEIKLDIRTDLYSLGITLYHMLAGEPPFADCNTSLLLTKKITDPVPSIKKLNPRLSDEICYIVHKLCAKDKRSRYAAPAEVVRDLESFLGGRFTLPAQAAGIEPPPTAPAKAVIRLSPREIQNPILHSLVVEQKVPVTSIVIEPQQVLFYEDDKSKEAYILLSGELEVLKAGRRIAVINEPGSFAGEMSTLLQIPRTATIRAVVKSILLEIKEDDFQDFLDSAPRISYHLAVSLAQRLSDTTENLKEAQSKLAVLREHFQFIHKTLEQDF
ncbi:MAG: hypothetical protein Kow0059_11870 [Candidatus Sumerlaeia bacterium]